MRKQFLIPVLVGVLVSGAAQAFAQSATVVMRNGERLRADVMDMGRDFSLRVNGQPRQVPLGDVVLLDFAGDGQNIPADEISKANAANGGFVVMRNGEQFNARLQDLMGKPLSAVFSDGRKTNLGDVSRIYFGSVSNVPGFPTVAGNNPGGLQGRPDWAARRQERREARDAQGVAPANARSVVVPSNVQWTNTGITLSPGQRLRFEASGEVRLNLTGEETAHPAGGLKPRNAARAPMPSVPVGALIGRIGNGEPFAIGDQTQALDMPGSGRLFLGINDDHVNDNSGNFVVKVWEP